MTDQGNLWLLLQSGLLPVVWKRERLRRANPSPFLVFVFPEESWHRGCLERRMGSVYVNKRTAGNSPMNNGWKLSAILAKQNIQNQTYLTTHRHTSTHSHSHPLSTYTPKHTRTDTRIQNPRHTRALTGTYAYHSLQINAPNHRYPPWFINPHIKSTHMWILWKRPLVNKGEHSFTVLN